MRNKKITYWIIKAVIKEFVKYVLNNFSEIVECCIFVITKQ